MQSHFALSKEIWRPKDPRRLPLDAFRRFINRKHKLDLKDYDDLHRYSVSDYTFWKDLWEYTHVIYSVPPEKIIAEGVMKEIPTWFPGARLNWAENMLCHDGDAIAVTAVRESGDIEEYSFRQLRIMVKDMASALRANGLKVGDRVAAILTNHIWVLVIALATSSIGAVFSCTATDMGVQGILDRYKQIQPKFVFTDTEVVYASKTFDLLPKVSQVARELVNFGLQNIVLLPSTKSGQYVPVRSDMKIPKSISLDGFLKTGEGDPLTFEQLPLSHPLFILYSSGTTGPPKCIVHSQGGIILQAKKEYVLGYGMTIHDAHFQYTTTGWMMWNSMINALMCGARIICYDGSPFSPDLRTFLKRLDALGATIFGTGPRFLAEMKAQGIEPLKLAPFNNLRSLFSTGAVLTAPMFEWTQNAFPDVYLISGSGGTDICSAFVSGVSTKPVYAGELQGKSLGMKIEVYDSNGKNIEDTGEPGELVCTRPHPSLPICFWNDPKGERLRKSYFEQFPGVWCQGDFVVKNPKTGGFIFLGRSDGVLNPSGVRMGTAEIYSVLERFSNVLDDTLCVGQRRPEDKDEQVLLFLKLRPGEKFTKSLVNDIKDTIRKNLSPRHVPAYIFPVEDIPYTVNNKKIEIAVKQIVSGSNMKPSGTVANPSSLQLYYKFRHLENLDEEGRVKEKAKL
ncbi:acetoacetate-CoA ligase [Abortiporus biennis]|nr:acetoacetate-CoA ligase [Abortiporus biennis]